MKTEWFRGTPVDRREGLEQAIRHSTVALGRLYEILDLWEQDLNSAETRLEDFDTPNWEVRQAFRNGDRARIRKLRDLMSFLKGD